MWWLQQPREKRHVLLPMMAELSSLLLQHLSMQELLPAPPLKAFSVLGDISNCNFVGCKFVFHGINCLIIIQNWEDLQLVNRVWSGLRFFHVDRAAKLCRFLGTDRLEEVTITVTEPLQEVLDTALRFQSTPSASVCSQGHYTLPWHQHLVV